MRNHLFFYQKPVMLLLLVLLLTAIHPMHAFANPISSAPLQDDTDPNILAALNAAAATLGWQGDLEGYTLDSAAYYESYPRDAQGCGDGAGTLEVFSAEGWGENLEEYTPGSYEMDLAGYDTIQVIEALDFHGHPARKISNYDDFYGVNDQVINLNQSEDFLWLMGEHLFQVRDDVAHETYECPNPFPADAQRLAEALYTAAVQYGLETGPVEATEAPTPQASPTTAAQIVLRASKSGFSEDIQTYNNTENAASVSISGQVTDLLSGELLPGAAVEIISGAGAVSAVSADDGSYTLTAAVPGGSGSTQTVLSFNLEMTADLRIEVMSFTMADFLSDGVSTTELQATAYDRLGNALPGRALEFAVQSADGSPWGGITVSNNITDDFGAASAELTSARVEPGTITNRELQLISVIVTDTETGVQGRAQIEVKHFFPQVDYYPTLPTCADCAPFPITVTVLDPLENPAAGIAVTAQLQSGSGELMTDKLAGAGSSMVSAETGADGQVTLYLKPITQDLKSESALSILVYEEKTNASANLQVNVQPLDIALAKIEQVAYTGVTNTNAYFYIHLKEILHRDLPLDRLGLERNSPVKYLVDIKQYYSDGSGTSPGYLETTYLTRTESGGIVLKDFNNNPPTPHVVPVNDGVTFYRVRVDAVDNDSGNPIYDPYLPNNDTIIAVRTGSPDGWLHTFLMNGVLSPSNHTGALIKCSASFLPGLGDAVTLIDALNEGYRLSQSVKGNEWDLYALGQKLAEASLGDAADAAGLSEKAASRVGIAGKIANCIKDHTIIELQARSQNTGSVSPCGVSCLQITRFVYPQGLTGEYNATFDPFFHGWITDIEGYQGVLVMTPPRGNAEVYDAALSPLNGSWKAEENGVTLFILPTDQVYTLQMNSPGDANVTIYEPGGGTNRRTINHVVEPESAITGFVNLSPGSDYAMSLDTNGDGQIDETLNPQIKAMDVSRPSVTEFSPTDESGANTTILAAFQDEGGSGINPGSFKIVVDGIDLTEYADVSDNGISVDISNLAAGEHHVAVGVRDGDGNTGLAEWSFQSSGTGFGGLGLPMILGSVLAGLLGLAGVVAFAMILLRKPKPQYGGPPGHYPPYMAPPKPSGTKRTLLLVGTGVIGFGCLCLTGIGLLFGVINAGSALGGVDIQAVEIEAIAAEDDNPVDDLVPDLAPAAPVADQPISPQATLEPVQPTAPMDDPIVAPQQDPVEPPTGGPWANAENPEDWLFYEDFLEMDNGWEEIQDEKFSTGFHEGGTYGFYFNVGKIIRVLQSPFDQAGMMGDMEVTISAISPEGSGFYGAMCRVIDLDNFYMVTVDDEGLYSFVKRSGGEFITIVESQPLPAYQPLDTVRLRCIGDTMSLYVEDTYVSEFSDSEFVEGYTGIAAGTTGDAVGAMVLFNRFLVTLP
jgi:hypothetical protein